MSNLPFDVTVDVFSDAICPWCYIGKIRLEKAIKELNEREINFNVKIEWHPYLLHPNVPKEGIDRGESTSSSSSSSSSSSTIITKSPLLIEAEKSGLKFGRLRYVANTLNAHRLILLTKREKGLIDQNILVDSIFQANFIQTKNISLTNVLLECCISSGVWKENEINKLTKYIESDEDIDIINQQNVEAHTVHAIGVFYF